MAAKSGRKFRLKWDGEYIAGMREKSSSFEFSPIETTTDDDVGTRTLLVDDDGELVPGTRSLTLSASGVTKDAVLLRAIALGQDLHKQMELEYPGLGEITGDFALVSLEKTGAHEDAIMFSCEFQNNGDWDWSDA
jgi:predicted secreted protein